MDNTDTNMQIVLESLTDDDQKIIQSDLEHYENSRFIKLLQAVSSALTPEDLLKTRVVITANFIGSVSSRQNKTEQEYTMTRGSGVVVGKTMPPDKDGIVDLLFPLQFLLSQGDDVDIEDIQHIGRHEAVHAHLYLLGTQPFDVYVREKFGEATQVFVKMASDLAEEYLAEQTSISEDPSKNWVDEKNISDALTTTEKALTTQLPAIPKDAEDYHYQLMVTTFNILYVLWKALAFLAAELRVGDVFKDVPKEIAELDTWDHYVAPSWNEYLQLLAKIPLSLDVDISQTDEVVKELAKHLQEWALQLGFDFHDTADGQGWFQVTRQL
jgi:hypothetical protein